MHSAARPAIAQFACQRFPPMGEVRRVTQNIHKKVELPWLAINIHPLSTMFVTNH